MNRLSTFVFTIILLSSLTSCASFNQSAGRAADNAKGAFGTIWKQKRGANAESENTSSTVVRKKSESTSTKSSRVAEKPVTRPTENTSNDDPEEENSLGGMERPGAR